MSAIFEDPGLAKIFCMVLIGIIAVLAAAVVILAWKKNQIIYVEKEVPAQEQPSSGSEGILPQEMNVPSADDLDDFTLAAEEIIPVQNTEAVPAVDLPKMETPLHRPAAEETAADGAELDVTVGGRTAHTTVRSFPCLIGREASACDLVISEPAVSRRHARLLLADGNLFIEDVSEHNGTYLNETKLPPLGRAKIHAGDVITLGRARITVRELTVQ